MLARHVTFLTEETAIRIKSNIVQLVLTSNISRNTLDHTSAAPEQLCGARQAFNEQAGLVQTILGGKIFICPPPNVKVFAFYLYHGLTPPLEQGKCPFCSPPPLNGPVNKSIGYVP